MQKVYDGVDEYGFIIAQVYSRQSTMMSQNDFSALAECQGMEEVCARIQKNYRNLQGLSSYTRNQLKSDLYKSMLQETKEFAIGGLATAVVRFFLEDYEMSNFFFLLSCKEHDTDLAHSFARIEPLGYFHELDTLKFSLNMEEVYEYCVKRTFLKDYFKKDDFKQEFADNYFGLLHLAYKRKHLENYEKILPETFEKILKMRGDRYNLDILFSTLGSDICNEARFSLFTKVSNFSYSHSSKLSTAASFEDIRAVLSKHPLYRGVANGIDEDGVGTVFVKLEMDAYVDTFTSFNEITALYAYLKLKEQEVKNIMLTVDSFNDSKGVGEPIVAVK